MQLEDQPPGDPQSSLLTLVDRAVLRARQAGTRDGPVRNPKLGWMASPHDLGDPGASLPGPRARKEGEKRRRDSPSKRSLACSESFSNPLAAGFSVSASTFAIGSANAAKRENRTTGRPSGANVIEERPAEVRAECCVVKLEAEKQFPLSPNLHNASIPHGSG